MSSILVSEPENYYAGSIRVKSHHLQTSLFSDGFCLSRLYTEHLYSLMTSLMAPALDGSSCGLSFSLFIPSDTINTGSVAVNHVQKAHPLGPPVPAEAEPSWAQLRTIASLASCRLGRDMQTGECRGASHSCKDSVYEGRGCDGQDASAEAQQCQLWGSELGARAGQTNRRGPPSSQSRHTRVRRTTSYGSRASTTTSGPQNRWHPSGIQLIKQLIGAYEGKQRKRGQKIEEGSKTALSPPFHHPSLPLGPISSPLHCRLLP